MVHVLIRGFEDIASVEGDFAALDVAIAVEELNDAHGGNALAGAGLADDAEGLAGLEAVGDVVDGLDNSLFGPKKRVQFFDFKQTHRAAHLSFDFGSMASRRPSPMQLMLMVQMPSTEAGNTQRHQ